MFLRVEIATPGQGMQKIKLDGPEITLGRDPACQVPFDAKLHSAVSWHHARVQLAAGRATLSDLGSSNGTFVNGTQLTGKKAIQQGDVIGLGQTGPKLRVVEIVTGSLPPVAQTIAEKMLPHGMLTPPVGTKPISVSSDSLPVRPSAKKRRRSPLGGLALGLLAIGAVAAAGYIVFTSQQKTDETKDDSTGEKPKDDRQAKADVGAGKKDDGNPGTKGAESGKSESTIPDIPLPPKLDDDETKKKKTRPPASTGAEIYKRALQSTGWVNAQISEKMVLEGTGTLVDLEKRLFLTAYHVVKGVKEANVYFPRYDAEGRAISDPRYYLTNERPVVGDVVTFDIKRDLAILRLRSLPASVLVLPLAAKGAEVADRVYTVGNPGVSSALWVYTEGSVRQIVQKKFTMNNKQYVEAWMLEAQFPTNPGDSGGAVVNDRIEIVGVNCSRSPDAQLMSNLVDLREIQVVLEQARRNPTPPPPFLNPGFKNP